MYTHRYAAATALDVLILVERGLIDVATGIVVSHYWLGLMASDFTTKTVSTTSYDCETRSMHVAPRCGQGNVCAGSEASDSQTHQRRPPKEWEEPDGLAKPLFLG